MRSFEGTCFSILSDSVSAHIGYVPEDYACFYDGTNRYLTGILKAREMWWGLLLDHLGGELLVNNSWAGSSVAMAPGFIPASAGCSDERCGNLHTEERRPDHILVYIGANDRGRSHPLTDNGSDGTDLSVFPNAYRAMLGKIKQNYPEAEIWCITMARTTCSRAPDEPYPAVLSDEWTTRYNRVIMAEAEAADCHVIDLFGDGVVCDTVDALHPNYYGMVTLSNAIAAIMEREP